MKSKLKDGSQRKSGKSAPCFRLFPKAKSVGSRTGISPVYLNVYDLSPINGYLFWAGIGIFHSAVQVHGVEYGFGFHDFPSSGVFEVEPRRCPGFKFRKSIFMGTTHLDFVEVRKVMELISNDYRGNSYHLIGKNCNHFSADICRKLTGKRIPKWINRLARMGSVCRCILPETLKETSLSPVMDIEVSDNEKMRLRSPFNRSSSMHQETTVRQINDCQVCHSEKKKRRTSLDSCLAMHQAKEVPPVSSLLVHSDLNNCVPPPPLVLKNSENHSLKGK